MEIPSEIVAAGTFAIVSLQAWTLAEVVKLKTKVAVIVATCDACNYPQAPMKKFLAPLLVATALVLSAAGCSSLYTRTPAPPVMVEQPVFKLGTNAAGVPTMYQAGTTNLPTASETWALNPGVAAALASAQSINAAVPSPVQPLVKLILGALVTGAGIYGGYKSRQLTLANAALAATTAAIEMAENASQLKATARDNAIENGGQAYLHATVKNL